MSTLAMPRRSPLLITMIIAAVALTAFGIFTQIWTDKLWFDAIDYPKVFSTQLVAEVGLFAVAALVMAGLIGGNMWIAFRARPPMQRSPESAINNLGDEFNHE